MNSLYIYIDCTQMTTIEFKNKWKANIKKVLGQYKKFPGEPLKSLGYFERMADLDFLTNNSQEGVRDGQMPADIALWRETDCHHTRYVKRGGKYTKDIEYTERAYVTGFIPTRIAGMMWYYMNLTDKVCLVKNYAIPVTYGACFQHESHPPNISKDLPYPATRINASVSQPDLASELKSLKEENGEQYTYIQCFDPVHGREARSNLYIDVITCLEKCKVSIY